VSASVCVSVCVGGCVWGVGGGGCVHVGIKCCCCCDQGMMAGDPTVGVQPALLARAKHFGPHMVRPVHHEATCAPTTKHP
jgi:hypothetical protein